MTSRLLPCFWPLAITACLVFWAAVVAVALTVLA